MGGGEEAEERRKRAKELGEKARLAVGKGGSSYVDTGNMIAELIQRRRTAEAKRGFDVCSDTVVGAPADFER
ncbi:uncharacterized protein A4U43_C01F27580 [Asparagus officinalis]|uniref:Uncharacterized protein n=1 Tax=Asparagus officinalis TaxID=4686 RepID=A0A5P1FWJ9_ASPOF|nr:uncharacterized protein A4U43_C01F27580 [Asparagus officinalis]